MSKKNNIIFFISIFLIIIVLGNIFMTINIVIPRDNQYFQSIDYGKILSSKEVKEDMPYEIKSDRFIEYISFE